MACESASMSASTCACASACACACGCGPGCGCGCWLRLSLRLRLLGVLASAHAGASAGGAACGGSGCGWLCDRFGRIWSHVLVVFRVLEARGPEGDPRTAEDACACEHLLSRRDPPPREPASGAVESLGDRNAINATPLAQRSQSLERASWRLGVRVLWCASLCSRLGAKHADVLGPRTHMIGHSGISSLLCSRILPHRQNRNEVWKLP